MLQSVLQRAAIQKWFFSFGPKEIEIIFCKCYSSWSTWNMFSGHRNLSHWTTLRGTLRSLAASACETPFPPIRLIATLTNWANDFSWTFLYSTDYCQGNCQQQQNLHAKLRILVVCKYFYTIRKPVLFYQMKVVTMDFVRYYPSYKLKMCIKSIPIDWWTAKTFRGDCLH
ncbi:hypothetical protein TNCV_3660621 [Trichonephila clavipes]|nr:hypothetical protein TNCV_3660621 [Trichonephila clavipes]